MYGYIYTVSCLYCVVHMERVTKYIHFQSNHPSIHPFYTNTIRCCHVLKICNEFLFVIQIIGTDGDKIH